MNGNTLILEDVHIPHLTKALHYKDTIIKGDFDAAYSDITSLVGSPREVMGYYTIANTKVASLEGAPWWIGENLCIQATRIVSLHNIHKIVKHAKGVIMPGIVRSNILGLLKIDGLNMVCLDPNRTQFGYDLELAVDYIKKHLKGDRNIHECQEEMLEAGLKEFARL